MDVEEVTSMGRGALWMDRFNASQSAYTTLYDPRYLSNAEKLCNCV